MQTPKDVLVTMSDQDAATILFALRYLQANMDDARGLMRDSEHFVDVKPLNGRQIDYLCQHLNLRWIGLDAMELDMALNLAHTVLIEAPTDRRITAILDRFSVGPDEANTLRLSLEAALKLGEGDGHVG
jgi:hypothetical protein